MTYTIKRYKSYQEYLDAEELSPESNYRLLSTGEVIEVPTENELNRMIACALIAAILKAQGISFLRYICRGDKELQVNPAKDKCVNRKPNVLLLTPEHILENKQAVFLTSPPPAFAAEVVSLGGPLSENHLRDYVWKRQQYEEIGIPEYWIIDPHQEKVTVLTLGSDGYAESVYVGERMLVSTTFPNIELTAADLIAGHIEDD